MSFWGRSFTVRCDKVEVITVTKQALGVYLSIFTQCMQVLRRRRRRPNDYLLGTAILLFVIVTSVSQLRSHYFLTAHALEAHGG